MASGMVSKSRAPFVVAMVVGAVAGRQLSVRESLCTGLAQWAYITVTGCGKRLGLQNGIFELAKWCALESPSCADSVTPAKIKAGTACSMTRHREWCYDVGGGTLSRCDSRSKLEWKACAMVGHPRRQALQRSEVPDHIRSTEADRHQIQGN